MADNTARADGVKSALPDNTQFLQAVFGDQYHRAHVASFNDPPDKIDKDRRGICWGGFRYGEGKRVVPTQNNYFTISQFRDEQGRAVRRKKNFTATYCIVVDDVGQKVRADDERLLPPSWKLETSPGNEQWGYILAEPCTDQALASGTLAMMVAKGLCPDGSDPGMKGVTRYVRLPIGVNRKSKYGALGHVCKMTWWQPDTKFSLDRLIEEFGSTREDVLRYAEGQGDGVGSAKDIGDDPILTALHDLGMYLKKNPKTGWHDIICPNADQHSDGDDSGTAVLVRTDGTYGFQCHHGHCVDKRAPDLITWITREHPETVEGTRFDPLDGFEEEAPPGASTETAKGVEEPKKKTLIEWPMEVVPTPVRWRVKRFLEANSIGVLWGEPGSFKSFIALDWALSVLYGNPWQGQFRVGDPADILIIAGEGRSGLARRVMAWRKHNGILLPPNGRMGLSKGAVHLNDEGFENVARIVEESRDRGSNPKLVLVDTVARNMGGNENAQEDMGRMVRAGDYLRQRLRGSTVLFVHHANKGGDIRGSTVLVGAADFIYRVERKGHDSVVLRCDKMKDADEPEEVFLTRKIIKLGEVVDEDGEISDIDSCVMVAGQMVMQVEESMEDRINAAVYALHAESKPPKSANAIQAKCGGDRNAVLKTIGEMLADGRLEKAKGVISVRGQHDHLL